MVDIKGCFEGELIANSPFGFVPRLEAATSQSQVVINRVTDSGVRRPLFITPDRGDTTDGNGSSEER